jgi:rhamnosyltransferase
MRHVNRIGIFFFFDKDGIVDDYIPYYLQSIKTCLSYLIVVVNGQLNLDGRRKIEKYADEIMIRENIGFDSWAYKYAIEKYGYENLKNFDELLMFNFTMFGGIYSFQPMFDEMTKRDCDFWGHMIWPKVKNVRLSRMQKTSDIPEYHMSYFNVVKKNILVDNSWKEYWDTLELPINYYDAGAVHEYRFTKFFSDHEFKPDTWIPRDISYRCSGEQIQIVDGKFILAKFHSPIVKRRAFTQNYDWQIYNNNGYQSRELLDYIRQNTNYDTKLILDNLIRTNLPSILHQQLHLNYIMSETMVEKPAISGKKIAAICFIYNEDMIDYCKERLANLPNYADIYIWVMTKEMQKCVHYIFSDLPNKIDIRVKSNNLDCIDTVLLIEARDILPKYELVLFVHEKKIKQLLDEVKKLAYFNRRWDNLLKSPIYVQNIIATFSDNPQLGILCPPMPYLESLQQFEEQRWEVNLTIAHDLLKKMKLDIVEDPSPLSFDCCFWFRPAAFKTLLAYTWKYDDFSTTNTATVVERLYPSFAGKDGFYSGYAMTLSSASLNYDTLRLFFIKTHQQAAKAQQSNNIRLIFRLFIKMAWLLCT